MLQTSISISLSRSADLLINLDRGFFVWFFFVFFLRKASEISAYIFSSFLRYQCNKPNRREEKEKRKEAKLRRWCARLTSEKTFFFRLTVGATFTLFAFSVRTHSPMRVSLFLLINIYVRSGRKERFPLILPAGRNVDG
jgi:hypothetical protein